MFNRSTDDKPTDISLLSKETIMEDRIRMGVSACLLGQQVRYDGGHKHDRYLTGTLGEYLEFVPVCPEVEAGFPIPRETFRLVGDPENPRLVTSRSNVDHTERMRAWAEERVRELEKENLCGFIFKSDSPIIEALRLKTTVKKNVNVLQHIMGYFKQQLTADEKQELLEVLDR
jgi:uncharacterized protein YbbK (DUF523 family)